MKKIANTPFRFARNQRRNAAAFMLVCFVPTTALSLPTAPQVVSGTAAISSSANAMTITNSANAIINWQGFSIGQNEITRFIQPSAASAVLNRVTGGDPSKILGSLQSNGKVLLINPSGIIFGANARVDVNGLIASTLNITNNDFLAGKMKFTADATAGKIDNQGAITTPSGGQVYLIAADVTNSGIITAPNGDVLLAAGKEVLLVDKNSPEIALVVTAPEGQSINLGTIAADAGRVGMYGSVVRQKGRVSADSAVRDVTGRIFLKSIQQTTVEEGSITTADGVGNADGGKVIVWSDGYTIVDGTIRAKGGVQGGDGGFIETSGAYLAVNKAPDLATSSGKGGTWLLDPYDIIIGSTDTPGTYTGSPDYVGTGGVSPSYIGASVIEGVLDTGTSVVVDTTGSGGGIGNITVSSSVNTSNAGAATLTLKAHNDIVINAALNMNNSLVLNADQDSSGAGNVIINKDVTANNITASGRDITFASLDGGTTYGKLNGNAVTLTAGNVITPNTSGAASEVTALSLNLTAVNGIGTGGKVFVGDILNQTSFTNTNNGVSIFNTSGSSTRSFTGSNTNGPIRLESSDATFSTMVSDLTSGGDIVLRMNKMFTAGGAAINAGSNTVYLSAYSNSPVPSLSINGSETWNLTDSDINKITAGKIIIGNDSLGNYTPHLSIGTASALNLSGATPVELYGQNITTGANAISLAGGSLTLLATGSSSDIALNGAITKTSGADSALTIKAGRNITVNQPISSIANKLNLTLNAHYQNDNAPGGVWVNNSLSTNGGNLVIGGGGNPSLTSAIGFDAITAGTGGERQYGVNLDKTSGPGNAIINTSGGDVTIRGQGVANSNHDSIGIYLGLAEIHAGGGNILLDGKGGVNPSSSDNAGVYITDAVDTTGSGTITIMGAGGANTSATTANRGVYVTTTSAVISTGNGAISITGNGGINTANPGNPNNRGVWIPSGTVQSTGTGSVSINGIQGNSGSAGIVNGGTLISNSLSLNSPGSLSLGGTLSGANINLSSATGFSFLSSIAASNNLNIDLSGGNKLTLPAALAFTAPFLKFKADKMDFSAVSGTLGGAGSIVTLLPKTPGRNIVLGTDTTDANNDLELSTNELSKITAATLKIGDLTSGSINIGAAIATPNVTSLSLGSGNSVTQVAAGTISVANLAIKALGNVDLSTAPNMISNLAASLGDATVKNFNFKFKNSGALNIGNVDGISGITTTFNGVYSSAAPDAVISLESGGALTQSSGNYLSGKGVYAKGSTVNLQQLNPTGIIAGEATAGSFQYASSNPIFVTDVGGASGIQNTGIGGDIVLTGNGIGQNAPLSTQNTAGGGGFGLSLTSNGNVMLQNAGNNVSRLNADLSGGTGSFSFMNSENLLIDGAVITNGNYINIEVPATENIIVSGTVSAGTGANGGLKVSGGGITYTGGAVSNSEEISFRSTDSSQGITLSGGVLGTSNTRNIDLITDKLTLSGGTAMTGAAAFNSINISPFTANTPIIVGSGAVPNTLYITDTSTATFNAPDFGIGSEITDAFRVASGAISVDSAISRPAGRVGLFSGAGITQSAPITVAGLGVIAGGAVNLGNALNLIGNLAIETGIGEINFVNSGALTITSLTGGGQNSSTITGITSMDNISVLSSGDISLNAPITSGGSVSLATTAKNINIVGSLIATDSVSLSGDTVSQAAGSVVATGNGLSIAADNIFFGGLMLGMCQSGGGCVDIRPFSSGRPIEIAGTLATPGTLSITKADLEAINPEGSDITGGSILIGDSSGPITFKGDFTTPGGMYPNLRGTTVSQAAGTTINGMLDVIASGPIALTEPTNHITHLGYSFTSPSSVAVATNVPLLTLMGTLTAGSGGLNIANNGGSILVDNAHVSSGGGSATLSATGDIRIQANTGDASIMGYPDVNLTVGGNLEFTASGPYKAYVSSGLPSTTNLTFNNTSGKVLFNGVQADATTSGNIGIFFGGVPGGTGSAAVVGSGLNVAGGDANNFTITVPTPTLDTCIANPALAGCSTVLPSLSVCTANSTTPGCSAVLPTLAACMTTPTAPGCSAVLPTLSVCTVTPSASGCSAVLPTLATCVTTPTAPGCSAVLPTLSVCTATPTASGCSAVLPTLAACITTPTAPGCSAVLPTLSACTATPSAPGCSVVLPTLAVCTTNPTVSGCSAVLPTLAICTTTPTTPGCSAVLPTIAKCTADPALLGCDVVLPPTAQNPVTQIVKEIFQIKTDPVAPNGLVLVAKSQTPSEQTNGDGGVKDQNAAGNRDGGEKDKKDKEKDKEGQEQQSASGDKKDAKPKKNYCN